MSGLPPELDFKEREPLDKKRLDRAFGFISSKIRSLESYAPDWRAAVDELRAFGLQRINEAILPAYQRVMGLASFGFLKADSPSYISVKTGDRRILLINDSTQRDLFTPTAFVTLTRVSTPEEWAIGRVEGYDAASGSLALEIIGSNVSDGAHSDWQITATAGSVAAAIALLGDTKAARDAALQIRVETATLKDAAVAAKTAAEKAAKDANAAAVLISGGPVASINGKTGNVALDVSWIGGLDLELSKKADKTESYTKSEIDVLLAKIEAKQQNRLANPGDGKWIFADKAPPGWIKPTGALINRSDFPDLWAFALTSGMLVEENVWANNKGCFSKGDGTSTFRVPDLRGSFLRVLDDSAGVDAGRALGTRQADAIRSHNHTATTSTSGNHNHIAWTDEQGWHNHQFTGGQAGGAYSLYVNNSFLGEPLISRYRPWTDGAGSHGHNVGIGYSGDHTHTVTVAAFGSTETRPVNTALIFVIKY